MATKDTMPDDRLPLRQMLELASAVIYIRHVNGKFVYVNPQFCRLHSRSLDELNGCSDFDLYPPEVVSELRANTQKVFAARTSMQFEERIVVGGETRTFLNTKFPIFDDAGAPSAICGIATEITQQKRTEQALREAALAVSSAHGVNVFGELARSAATILNADLALVGLLTEAQPPTVRTVGVFGDGAYQQDIEYALSATPCRNVVGSGFYLIATDLQQVFGDNETITEAGFESYAGYPLNDAAGSTVGVLAVLSRKPLREAEFVESVLKIVAVRVSAELDRSRAEVALRASEEQYRTIFNATLDGLVLRDASYRLVDVNQAILTMSGYRREELLGTMRSVFSAEAPSRALHERALLGEPVQSEFRGTRRDGTKLVAEVRAIRIQHQGQAHVLNLVRDITAQEEAEAKRLQLEMQLRQAQKMEAIGHLTGGIAHDFNNILTSIIGYVVMASERPSARADPKLVHYLEHAHESARRARDLVQQMLMFSRGQRGERRRLSLSSLVEQSLKLVRSMLPSSVELDQRLDPAGAVEADPVQLEQVLLNLCLNARDAVQGCGSIRVTVTKRASGPIVCASCRHSMQGDFVELRVADSGPGIAPEVMERMFEPFFTTKEVGKGSGMGLSTVHGIVHEHGGHVEVASHSGRGAEFRVLLPAVDPARVDDPLRHLTTTQALSGVSLKGRVLLVDDDDSVLDFMCERLESWGLEIESASNGLLAQSVFARDPASFDLAIVDQTMPRMTGLELSRKLRDIRNDLPIILYTGYGEGLSEPDAKAIGIAAFLRKPLEPDKLAELLKLHLPAR